MRLLLILSILLFGLSACWPTVFMSTKDKSMPASWKTFQVFPIEVNSATAPSNYNLTLSEDFRSGIQNNTRLKLVSEKNDSTLLIQSVVSNYQTSPIAVQNTDNAAQNRLSVTVNFTINTPSKGLEEIKFTSTRFADYNSDQQLADVEGELLRQINQQLTQDLINKLLSNW